VHRKACRLGLEAAVGKMNVYTRSQVGFLFALLVLSVQAAKADTIIPVDPTATYLLTSNDIGSKDAIPINLGAFGLKPGDTVIFQALGNFCYYSTDCNRFNVAPQPLLAVFSTSSALLPSGVLNRVPGAIGGVGTTFTGSTFYNQISTNITDDFFIGHDPNSTEITIPAGAAFLFVSVSDSLYGDNVDPDKDLGLKISRVAEPSSLTMLGCGIVSLLILALWSGRH
jgi:hypothetical protein